MQRLVGATLPLLAREAARSLPNGLPRFVMRSLDAYVGCGDFARGFFALRCERCPHERYVAFSCKTRGFCPSCAGKRMTALAAYVVDAVLPVARVRGVGRGVTGGATAVQRFGSGLNLHVHPHALALDGVFVGDDATKLRFASDHPWTTHEVGVVLLDLVTRPRGRDRAPS